MYDEVDGRRIGETTNRQVCYVEIGGRHSRSSMYDGEESAKGTHEADELIHADLMQMLTYRSILEKDFRNTYSKVVAA